MSDTEVEVCGRGVVAKAEVASEGFLEGLWRMTPAQRAQATTILEASAVPESRALGHWMASMQSAEPILASYAPRIAACADNASCRTAIDKEMKPALDQAAQPGLERLVDAAVSGRRPAVYAMAMQACQRAGDSAPSCTRLSIGQWTQADPRNAIPWLFAAASAAGRKDASAGSEALHQAAHAATSRLYGDSLVAYAEPALASAAGDLDRYRMTRELVSIQFGWQLPPYAPMLAMCSAPEVRDSNRWQTCDALAGLLTEKGSTLLEHGIGIRLAERVGWARERVDALRLERDALMGVQGGSDMTPEMFSCAGMARDTQRWQQQGRIGEVAMARKALARSGRSVERAALEIRAARDEQRKAASQAETSGAASAPAR